MRALSAAAPSVSAALLPAGAMALAADDWKFEASIYGYFPSISGTRRFPAGARAAKSRWSGPTSSTPWSSCSWRRSRDAGVPSPTHLRGHRHRRLRPHLAGDGRCRPLSLV